MRAGGAGSVAQCRGPPASLTSVVKPTMPMLRKSFPLLALLAVSTLFGASIYDTVVFGPNLQAGGPGGLGARAAFHGCRHAGQSVSSSVAGNAGDPASLRHLLLANPTASLAFPRVARCHPGLRCDHLFLRVPTPAGSVCIAADHQPGSSGPSSQRMGRVQLPPPCPGSCFVVRVPGGFSQDTFASARTGA